MKSVKSKLFLYYSLTITIILILVSTLSLYFAKLNQQTSLYKQLQETKVKLYDFFKKDENLDIQNIDKYVKLKDEYLIIFKNKEKIFTNKSKYKTDEFLDEIDYEEKFHRKRKYKQREEYLEHKYDDDFEDGFIKRDEFLFVVEVVQKDKDEYEIYLALDEHLENDSIEDLSEVVLKTTLIVYLCLLLIGYILISRTIKPLRQILNELKAIQEDEDLSKRLKSLDTKDEFEELVNSFNKMRANIEISVENIKQFSSDASHELKTPITVIQGFIELSENEDLSIEELRQIIEKIDKEQKKLQDIIANFLLLARLDKEAIINSKCELDTVVFEALEENLEKIEEKNLELKLDIQEDLEVNFSKKYLYIVVNNLLSNAIKYTNSGFIHIKAYKKNYDVYLSIEDSGVGLSKEDSLKIFERFYRVDKARTNFKDGVGLGLAIVKNICNKYNSVIEVSSKEGEGSTFKIQFAKNIK